MSKENNFSEDEYRFTEVEPSDIEPSEKHEKRQLNSVQKRIFIALAVIVIVLTIYKLFSVFIGSKEKSPVVTPTVPLELKSPPGTPFTEKPEPTVSTDETQNMAKLQQQAAENARLITGLQAQVTDLQSTISGLNRSLSTVDSTLQSVRQELSDLKKPQLPTVKVVSQLRPRPVRHIRKRRFIVYWVNAIVPGRAWLKSDKGTTITVRTGSILNGYGRILRIDPQRGIVLTSSGKVIKFSPEEF